MSVVGWWFLGDRVASSVVDSLCDGPVVTSTSTNLVNNCIGLIQAKTVIEILFLLHLISAFPIILNPPFQFFEEIMKVPSGNHLLSFRAIEERAAHKLQMDDKLLQVSG